MMRFARLQPAIPRLMTALALACGSGGARSAPPVGIGTLATEISPRISRCLIRREPALIERWLRTLPGSPEEDRLVRNAEPGFPACFDEYAQISGLDWVPGYDKANIRAALVRTLLQSRRSDLPAHPPAGADRPYQSITPGSGEAGADASAIVAADLGFCLARKHWSNVVAIIRAVDPKAGTGFYSESRKARAARKREAAAVDSELARMIPSIAGCVPAGARLRIERPRLRILVEEAAYHMTNGAS
jgi:hypothetical protein